MTADQSRPVPRASAVGSIDAEKIAQIADWIEDMEGGEPVFLDRLRSILAEPGPAVPPHGIDRDALRTNVTAALAGFEIGALGFEETADRILALVRPVEGVTLTRDEKVVAAAALRWALLNPGEGETGGDWRPRFRALAERLEARS